MSTSNCPKCSGTGFIARFGHVHNGECYDCNGTGQIATIPAITVAPAPVVAVDPTVEARRLGDLALAGSLVGPDAAWDAYNALDAVIMTAAADQWDIARQSALFPTAFGAPTR